MEFSYLSISSTFKTTGKETKAFIHWPRAANHDHWRHHTGNQIKNSGLKFKFETHEQWDGYQPGHAFFGKPEETIPRKQIYPASLIPYPFGQGPYPFGQGSKPFASQTMADVTNRYMPDKPGANKV